tara:strand:+ start:13688 stop:14542 length:855 start_codon:yes stop_codon:yes gene_type:complete
VSFISTHTYCYLDRSARSGKIKNFGHNIKMDTNKQHSSRQNQTNHNITEEEALSFSRLSDSWWDPDGPFRPLHKINPTRISYIRTKLCNHFQRDEKSLTPFENLNILDIGCGGGLISEPLTKMGASVTGIDAVKKNIDAARVHAKKNNLTIDYRYESAESLAEQQCIFDVVLALEVVEHVADLESFIKTCSDLLKPGGAIIFSTLNRTPASFVLGIIAAEYILRWLPKGTHDWRKFIRPSELVTHMRMAGIATADMQGISYDVINAKWRESDSLAVNYLVYGKV